jgi:hypothetical protein
MGGIFLWIWQTYVVTLAELSRSIYTHMENTTNNSISRVFITIAALGAIVLLAGLAIWGVQKRGVTNNEQNATSTVQWKTYTNDQYNFSLQYPDTWEVVADAQIPGIHVIKKGSAKPNYLTHHSKFTHVSVYPQGIGTEGIFGQTTSSNVSFKAPVKRPLDYVLNDNTRWATFAGFTSVPSSWKPWGFVFAGTVVENEQVECIAHDELINKGVCEIDIENEDAETVRAGIINAEDRKIQEQILASFQFTSNATPIDENSGTKNPPVTRVKIYMVEMAEAEPFTGPTIGCGDRLVPVNRDVKGQAVLKATLEDLFSIKTRFYGESGFYNSLSQSNIKVASAVIDTNGKATVKLTGTLMSAGTCDDPRIQEQIKATVMQFPTVKSAEITINGKTLKEYFDMR